eukprot:6663271-Prymnesium_polylepis.1
MAPVVSPVDYLGYPGQGTPTLRSRTKRRRTRRHRRKQMNRRHNRCKVSRPASKSHNHQEDQHA